MLKKRTLLEAFGFSSSKIPTCELPSCTTSEPGSTALEINTEPLDNPVQIDTDQDFVDFSQKDVLLSPVELPFNMKFKSLSKWDISLAVGRSLNDVERNGFLLNTFVPPKDYKFYPVMQSKRNRYHFQTKIFKLFSISQFFL